MTDLETFEFITCIFGLISKAKNIQDIEAIPDRLELNKRIPPKNIMVVYSTP